jgi:hypothetical protein
MKIKDRKKIETLERVLDGERLVQAIRPDGHGEVDDVAIHGDLFRLERMTNDSWWCCIYRGDKRTSFNIFRPRGKKTVIVRVQDDSIGCVDDTKSKK